mmetsp:Transcript_6193/g.17436  ORF Transcript_6193/g.17436 Transcript_6193/m.17436 type:complete len:121 (+) Transcript_6193:4785-5147(+)
MLISKGVKAFGQSRTCLVNAITPRLGHRRRISVLLMAPDYVPRPSLFLRVPAMVVVCLIISLFGLWTLDTKLSKEKSNGRYEGRVVQQSKYYRSGLLWKSCGTSTRGGVLEGAQFDSNVT